MSCGQVTVNKHSPICAALKGKGLAGIDEYIYIHTNKHSEFAV